jgi:hypothetical protein
MVKRLENRDIYSRELGLFTIFGKRDSSFWTGECYLKRRYQKYSCSNSVAQELETINGLPLITSTVKCRPDLDSRVFEITTPHESYLLQAETEAEALDWTSILQNTIVAQLTDNNMDNNNMNTNILGKNEIYYTSHL